MRLFRSHAGRICSTGIILLLICCTVSCQLLSGSGNVELVKAIPSNAAFIVKINDPADLADALAEVPYGKIIRDQILPKDLLGNHGLFAAFLHEGGYLGQDAEVPLLASLHLASASSLNSIHFYPLDMSGKAFIRQLDNTFSGAARQEWNYEGIMINEVLLADRNEKLTVAFSNGVLIASTAAFLVEDAVKQLRNNDNLLTDDGFKRLYRKETDEADANIWMPFANSRMWLSLFASSDGLELLSEARDLASWLMMDIYLNDDALFLSGMASAENGKLLSRVKRDSGCQHTPYEVLPFNTAAFSHRSILADSTARKIGSFGLGRCLTSLMIEPLNSNIEGHLIYLLSIKDQESLESAGGISTELKDLLGALFLEGSTCHTSTVNGHLAFSANRTTLDNYRTNVKNGQILSGDATFQALSEDLRTDAVMTAYARTLYNRETFKAVYESAEEAAAAYKSLRGFNQAVMQFSPHGELFLASATLTYNEGDAGSHSNLAWAAQLDAPAMVGPRVIRLNSAGTEGVLVQDTEFNLYLLDKAGNTIWRHALESRWMGSIYSITLFEGSSNVLAFNTQTKWHLLDGDGEDMAGFPLNFKDRASAPLSMIRQGDKYYVFIPSENGNLYGYELNGKPLPGWNPKEKTGRIAFAPQLAIEGGKVHISAINEDGMAYIWELDSDRQGRNAFRTQFPSDHYLDLKAEPFKIKNVMSDGELISMNARGRVGRYKMPVDRIDQFTMGDVHGNADPEILLSDSRSIWLFDYTGQRIWKRDIPGTIGIVELPGGASAISVHNTEDGTFQLLGSDGSPMLEDKIKVGDRYTFSNLDLLGSGQPVVVTSGSENEVFCYRVAIPK